MQKFALLLAAPFVCSYLSAGTPTTPAKQPVPPPPSTANRPVLTSAAARRNENVQVNRIDNDAVKEANIRLGDNVSIVSESPVESSYYASEHGRPPGESIVLRAVRPVSAWHGELFHNHQNSVFNARTFFQVGGVKPSRQNNYGGRVAGHLKHLGFVTFAASQRKIRGMVNGNVLVPLASERTPLAADPRVRELVARFLSAYPDELPNRPDFDPRALNTNAPQRIDDLSTTLRLDRQLGAKGQFAMSHTIVRQRIDAFQLVAGQNPDTELHTHRSRISYMRSFSAGSDMIAGMAFNRVMSDLRAEPGAAPTRIRIGYQIEELGPDSQFPIHRAQNSYRIGAVLSKRASGGAHTITYGGDLSRYDLNGIETSNSRGFFSFTNNFGRSAIENLRLGTPSTYEVSIGEFSRSFRNEQLNLFVADQWKLAPRLQVYYGVRYTVDTAPRERHGLSSIPYGCDCNNLSPRFSIAFRAPHEWLIRTSYSVSFSQIPQVTYQQARYNTPLVRYVQVQLPDLLEPLRDVNAAGGGTRTAPTVLSPDLVSPYSHQYNFSLERPLNERYLIRLGYIGSRTFKLMNSYIQNRAAIVPGVPLTLATVDQRRADPRYYEIYRIVNGGIAYLDAAQATIEARYRSGLVWGATYTFGKSIDEGADYTSTAANRDLTRTRSQSQYEAVRDKKSLSTFDSPHSFMGFWSYDLPFPRPSGPLSGLLSGWQMSGSTLVRVGTPLSLFIGSDAPGFGNVDGGPSDRPNILDPSILGMRIGHPDQAPFILRRDRFAYIRPGELRGNLGRGTFRKGGIANVNAAITKQWRWSDHSVQFRAEAYNFTNTPQFDEPQRNLTSPSFGRITNTLNDGRVFQLGLRLSL